MLPFAVGGPPDGDSEFNIARADGCSSLLHINASKAGGTFARWGFGMNMCGHAVARRRVPLISLQVCLQTPPSTGDNTCSTPSHLSLLLLIL